VWPYRLHLRAEKGRNGQRSFGHDTEDCLARWNAEAEASWACSAEEREGGWLFISG
jgi:hypothetical protein